MTFYSCSGCGRYVKQHERACPFCGAARRSAERTVPSQSIRGISRGHWLTAGAAALALVNCDAPNGDTFFECSESVSEGGAITVSYCQRWVQYCSSQGACVTIDGSAPCAAYSGNYQCTCTEDAGAAVQHCTSYSGCYGAPPARLERLVSTDPSGLTV